MNISHFLDKENTMFPIVATNMRYLREFFGYDRNNLGSELEWTAEKLTNFELGLTEPNAIELLHFARFFHAVPEDIICQPSMNYQQENHPKSDFVQRPDSSPHTLSEMIMRTKDIQNMLDSFRAFYGTQMEHRVDAATHDHQWSIQYKETMDLMEEYIALNRKVIDTAKY